MFYLSGNMKGRKYGVIDTSDGTEDFMTLSEVLMADSRGYKVFGLFRKQGYLYCVGMTPVSVDLLKRKKSCPVRLKLAKGLSFVQTIYMGYRIKDGHLEFLFFDDGGMSGLCVVTGDYFVQYKNELELDFVGVDQRRTEVLMRRMRDSGGFNL